MGVAEKMERGKIAISNLASYKTAQKEGDQATADIHLKVFDEHKEYLGYGYLEKPEDAVPPVAMSFNAFHIMVALGMLFPLIFIGFIYYSMKGSLQEKKLFLGFGTILYILGMIASQAGWVVAEVGRQPWAIQGLLPVTVARTNLTTGTVQTTFFIFLVLFTVLLIAEVSIMAKQISIGPKEN